MIEFNIFLNVLVYFILGKYFNLRREIHHLNNTFYINTYTFKHIFEIIFIIWCIIYFLKKIKKMYIMLEI